MNARDREIIKAQEESKVRETLILQKINHTHRIAFAEKFPGQCEHVLRLLMERLHNGLDKRDNVNLDDVKTWKLSPAELYELTDAVYKMYQIREGLKKDVDAGHIN